MLAVRHGVPYLLLVVMATLIIYEASEVTGLKTGWPPDTSSEPAEIQIKELAIRPGDVFKGRSALLLEMKTPKPISWGPNFFPIVYFNYRQTFGYDFMNDAQYSGVPSINEYGHWISPPMLALLAASFYDRRDRIDRASHVPRVFRPNLARLMGTALVVSDAAIPGEKLLYSGDANGHPLMIHKVANPNLGQYSPVQVAVATDAHKILDFLQDPAFDGEKLAVVEKPLDAKLTPASGVTVRIEKGPVIRVVATSPGVSLLVLPFDWSHCLQVSGQGARDIFPVNLSQTGLLIEGKADVSIVYRYGLFSGTSCRLKDRERAKALDLENAATGRLFYDARGSTGTND